MIDHLYAKRPAVIAHRGASHAAPENTLAAFNLAAALNADAVELDVKLSKDGVPVVMHDATVDRTTDGAGRVADLALADLKTLDAGAKKDAQYAGERVPTLAEVFEAVADPMWINVELTNYTTRGDGLVGAVVQLIHKMNLQSRVLLSSFDPFNIRAAKRLDPSLAAAVLTSHDMPVYLREVWLAPVIPHEARHPDLVQLKRRGVAGYQRSGRRVNVWTVNEPADMREFVRQGVDGLITDVPDVASRVANELGPR